MEQNAGWHVGNWGVWGWLETGLKAAGLVAGIIAFFDTAGQATVAFGDHPNIIAVVLLALLSLVALGVTALRIQQREIISIAFALLNVAGHIAALIALLRVPEDGLLLVAFAMLYAIGQAVKLQFLRATGYTESGQSSTAMLRVTGGILAVYALLAVFLLAV